MSYQKDWEQVVSDFRSNAKTGLSKEEVQKRLIEYGKNELVEKKNDKPTFKDIAKQFCKIIIENNKRNKKVHNNISTLMKKK